MNMSPEDQRSLAFHRVQAIEDATAHLAKGASSIAAPGWHSRRAQPDLQQLAVGVEKLAKLTLGMMDEADTGSFPDQKIMRNFGHDVGGLVRLLETRIEQRSADQGRVYVFDLKRALDLDPYWTGLLEGLDTAASAQAGRYVHEAALGGAAPAGRSVDELWQELDVRAVTLLRLGAYIAGPNARDALAKARSAIVQPVVRWWHLIFRTWQHGLVGPLGQQFASEVSLSWSELPPSLGQLARSL